MRVKIEFTLSFDAEEYRDVYGVEMTNTEIRDELKSAAITSVLYQLLDDGVTAKHVVPVVTRKVQ